MSNVDTYIISSWSAEQQKQVQQDKASKQDRYAALKEFRESFCDLFNAADFYYYAERIGCNVSYLLRAAKYTTDPEYKKYYKPHRDIDFRYWFWKQNGHSITKSNPLFN